MRHRPLLPLLLLAATMQLPANDGVYYTSGSMLVPVCETDIAVRKEVLDITLGADSFATVTVDYTLQNDGPGKTVLMAFEAAAPYDVWVPFDRQGRHPFIQDFTVLFNGSPLPYRNAVIALGQPGDKAHADLQPLDLSEWKAYDELPDSIGIMDNMLYNERLDSFSSFAYAYYFDAPFRQGQNTVRHTYRYKMSWGVGRDFEVPYALTPITRWKGGRVGEFTLRIKSATEREILMNDSIFLSAPFTLRGIGKAYQLQSDYIDGQQCLFAPLGPDNVLEWHGTDFSPRKDLRIEPLYLLKDGVRGMSSQGHVAIAADGTEYRYIARSGDSLFIEAQDYGLIPREGTRIELRQATKGQGYVYLNDDIRRANVRKSPSKQGRILFTIDNDGELPEGYPCLGYVSHKEADGLFSWWYKVRVNGKIGYISEQIAMWDSVQF